MKGEITQQELSQGQDSSPDSALLFANADADANADTDAGGSTIALPELCPGELKRIKAIALVFVCNTSS